MVEEDQSWRVLQNTNLVIQYMYCLLWAFLNACGQSSLGSGHLINTRNIMHPSTCNVKVNLEDVRVIVMLDN